MKISRTACAAAILVTLGGCGQKGPLTLGLPGSESSDSATAEAPSTDPQEETEQTEQEERSGDDC